MDSFRVFGKFFYEFYFRSSVHPRGYVRCVCRLIEHFHADNIIKVQYYYPQHDVRFSRFGRRLLGCSLLFIHKTLSFPTTSCRWGMSIALWSLIAFCGRGSDLAATPEKGERKRDFSVEELGRFRGRTGCLRKKTLFAEVYWPSAAAMGLRSVIGQLSALVCRLFGVWESRGDL